MREIVFDTETTGLDPRNGDRIVEIGCIELINHIPTGKRFHRHINPERAMSIEAARVHGLDDAFLRDKPLFSTIVSDLMAFIGDAPLIAHNATFDLEFLNSELARTGHSALSADRLVDTLLIARRKHPAAPNSLDALCSRYGVDTSRRTFHGALLDAELLSEVYVELIGGRQANLILGEAGEVSPIVIAHHPVSIGARPVARLFTISADELAAHRAAIAAMRGPAIWMSYLGSEPAAAAG